MGRRALRSALLSRTELRDAASATPLEKLLHLGEEAGAFGVGLVRGLGGELGQELALTTGQTLRRLDIELHEEVARIARAQHRHAFAPQPQLPSGLCALGNADPRLGSVERADGEFAPERCLHHRDRHPAIEVGAVALEERMRLDGEKNVKVAGRPAPHSRLALAGETNAGAVLDAGGNIDRERALPGPAAGAGAFVARIFDRLPAAVTGGAGAFDGEEALLRAHPPMAAAGLAGYRLGAGAGAGAGAGFAGHRSRHSDRGGLAAKRLFERDLEIVAQVRAPLAAR